MGQQSMLHPRGVWAGRSDRNHRDLTRVKTEDTTNLITVFPRFSVEKIVILSVSNCSLIQFTLFRSC